MSLYSDTAELLQYVLPRFYKSRYFKKVDGINRKNIFERKVEPELLWLKDYLPKDAVAMDIGANVGSYIFLLEKILPPENIYAFEPNKELFKRLKRIFPGVQIFSVALSDENSLASFKIPVVGGKPISSRGTLQTGLSEDGETAQVLETVQTMRLDDWAAENHISKVDFIKIDVEGNEIATLRGAEHTIKKYRPTLMVEMEQRHHAEPLWNFVQEINSWGYAANYLCRETFTLKNLSQDFLGKQDAANVKNYRNYINNIIFTPEK